MTPAGADLVARGHHPDATVVPAHPRIAETIARWNAEGWSAHVIPWPEVDRRSHAAYRHAGTGAGMDRWDDQCSHVVHLTANPEHEESHNRRNEVWLFFTPTGSVVRRCASSRGSQLWRNAPAREVERMRTDAGVTGAAERAHRNAQRQADAEAARAEDQRIARLVADVNALWHEATDGTGGDVRRPGFAKATHVIVDREALAGLLRSYLAAR